MPPKSYVEVLNPEYDGIWREDLWEVIRIKLNHEGGALVIGLVFSQEKEEAPELTLYACIHTKRACEHTGRWHL